MKKWLFGLAALIVAIAGGTQLDNLGGRTNEAERMVFNAVAATTSSVPFLVNDFQHIGITASVTTTATTTLQFACSNLDETTNLVNAQGRFVTTTKNPSARWDWVQIVDLQNGLTIDGDTGVQMTGTDVRQFELDVNNFRWCMAYQNWTSGTTTVTFRPVSNQ